MYNHLLFRLAQSNPYLIGGGMVLPLLLNGRGAAAPCLIPTFLTTSFLSPLAKYHVIANKAASPAKVNGLG